MTCTVLLVTLMMVCTVSLICGTQSSIKSCSDLREPCGFLYKTNFERPHTITWCNCSGLGDYYCNMEWEKNCVGVTTFPSPGNRIIENQFAFCMKKQRPCAKGETAATVGTVYESFCKCPNSNMEIYDESLTGGHRNWTFKCQKETCAHSTFDCRRDYLSDNEITLKHRYLCNCPEGRKCLLKIDDYDFIEHDYEGRYKTYTCQ